MVAQLIEIEAVFLGEKFRFENADGDVIIGEVRLSDSTTNNASNAASNVNTAESPADNDPFGIDTDTNAGRVIAVKGQADIDELTNYLTYRFYGRWTSYKNKRTGQEEQQFAFQSFVRQQPYDRAGVMSYLCEAGAGHGLGAARAGTLWERFNSDAVRVMRETPEVAREALIHARMPISEEQSLAIAAWLDEEKHIEACKLELTTLMNGRGFPKTTIREAVRQWGNKAAEIIRHNPYSLMQFRGCGFKRTDAMYLDLGRPADAIKRQTLCAWHSVAKNTEGHTWFPLKVALEGIRSNVTGTNVDLKKAMTLAKRSKALSFIRTDHKGNLIVQGGDIWCAENRKAGNEQRLAKNLAAAMAEPTNWPVDLSEAEKLSDHQRERLAQALTGVISILGGSPGTGKTFTAAELIGLLVKAVGVEQIAVAAPTGKAAVRLTEALDSYGLSLRARTIHSLLGVRSANKTGGWGFEHDEQNTLPYKFLIIDESSMVDCDLAASLLAARAKGCHILFIGDVNQLPPVGHGAPLRDMIAAELPYGELREIRRNSGAIVEACAAIRDGQTFRTCQAIDIDAGENLRLIQVGKPEEQIEKMLAAIKVARGSGFDPVWDVQVLVPVNAKSPLARKKLNDVLQRELNSRPGVAGSPFKVGDKIVNTKNGWFQPFDPAALDEQLDNEAGELQVNDRGEVYVANGELAEVVQVMEKLTVAKLSNPTRLVKIPRGKSGGDGNGDDAGGEGGDSSGGESGQDDKAPTTGCSWDLGYALSVHKSQGSEWAVVIVMIDEYAGAKMVCSRELDLHRNQSREKTLLGDWQVDGDAGRLPQGRAG
jgi:exodeoxyribonuclease V alpha subunit